MNKTIKVASVQMKSVNENSKINMINANILIQKAVNKGAKIILLPEFAIVGYELNENIWKSAESSNGETVTWLKELSKKYNIWLGTSFLETDGKDFYNTFVLTNPKGGEDGRVYKEVAGSVEAYLFKGRESNHIIETEFGKVGVIICYDGMKPEPLHKLSQESPDIILLPHSAAEPSIIPILFPQKAVDFLNNYTKNVTSQISKLFGVPSVMANKVGEWKSNLPKPYPPQNGNFLGYSAIADAHGKVLKQNYYEEDIIINEVILDKSLKKKNINIENYNGFSTKVTWHFKWWFIVENKGQKSYAKKVSSL